MTATHEHDVPAPEEKVHTEKVVPRFTDWGVDTLIRKPPRVPEPALTTKTD